MLNIKKTMDGKPRDHRNMMCSRNGKHLICHKARLENWAKAWSRCFVNSVNLRFSKKQWLPLKNVKQKHDMIRDAFWEDMIQEMWWATLQVEKQMRILLQESRWEMVVAWVSHSYGEKLTDLKIRKRQPPRTWRLNGYEGWKGGKSRIIPEFMVGNWVKDLLLAKVENTKRIAEKNECVCFAVC